MAEPPKNATGSPLVMVTGGGSGIGAATATVLAQRGWRPVIVDIRPPDAADGDVIVLPDPVDISDENAVARAVAYIEDEVGPLAGLVNAAGILGKMHPPARLRMSDWDRDLAVDLRGTYLTCREAGSRMAERGQGAIVNIASVTGMISAPVHGYAPAKAAVINLTMTLAAEWGPRGVRVNAVSPGFTGTEALRAGIASGALDESRMKACAALQRLVEPREVALAIAWLLGPDSSAVTGINMPVDAGFVSAVGWQPYGGLRS